MMTAIHNHGLEVCNGCGSANRYWISKRGYGEDYANWAETGLCPKCLNPKEESMSYAIVLDCLVQTNWYAVVCCQCKKVMELKPTEEQHMMMNTSHTYCEACAEAMLASIGGA